MKRLIFFAGLLLAIGTGLTGCYKDVISPGSDPDGPPQFVSFSEDLVPIFDTKCALSGCHVDGAHKPYLNASVAYQEIVNGGFVNLVIPKESILYKMVYGAMSEYIPSKSDKQKVYDWIRNGAPNN